jgi:putative membrane protein
MKPHVSISLARRALAATSISFLVGAATLVAQTSSSGSSTGSGSGSSTGSSSGNYQSGNAGSSGSSSSSGTYQSPSSSSSSSNYGSTSGSSGKRDTTMSTSGTGSMNNSSDKLGWGDKRFVTKAADDGQAEVQVAKLAAERATNPDVKQFAERMVRDHTAVNQELMGIASSKGVKLDKDDGKDRTYNKLAKKSGADFDREFVEHMIDEHEKDIKLFEKASNDAKDSDIRGFASKHLGHLREHLQIVEGLRASVMPTGRDNNSSGRSTSTTSSSNNATSSGSSSDNSTSSSVNGTSGTSNQTSGASSSGTGTSGGSSDTTRRSGSR